ncbi:hypothetical protein VFPFJ_00674 [Purpureocillium lilacinum]|uniref:Uncharacterized protein n=1 Tax=Purpureocillium lilacinum TaxID=33203 RepID=A0A179HVN7_PURLI|nr:hypothetical protein VFPFJ_00674 [Purpureocillium lilacinum]OAQ94565.1 hypothetical protein VFPFJ_00674 [Purpureocillium lilacinum]
MTKLIPKGISRERPKAARPAKGLEEEKGGNRMRRRRRREVHSTSALTPHRAGAHRTGTGIASHRIASGRVAVPCKISSLFALPGQSSRGKKRLGWAAHGAWGGRSVAEPAPPTMERCQLAGASVRVSGGGSGAGPSRQASQGVPVTKASFSS